MLLNCGVGEDSWESLGLQGDPTSPLKEISPECSPTPEKGVATHSSILAWEIPWIEEAGRLQSMGLQRVSSGVSSSCGARGGFLPRHDEDLREPLVRRQGSQVSLRVARGQNGRVGSP